MTVQALTKFIMDNLTFILVFQSLLIFLLLVLAINAYWKLSYMQKRYRKMMTGMEGVNLERLLMGHIDETKRVSEENNHLQDQIIDIDRMLRTAITRVGVVRFQAFPDMGSDLSYAVALLNDHNDGVILSSIFGREDSRSYAKPIKDGASSYTLTQEETSALREAMGKAKK